MVTTTEFLHRRQKLLEQMEPESVAIIPAAPERVRNADVYYPYRQSSNFHYLTGFPEPSSVIVLLNTRKASSFILFNQAKDPDKETWTGPRVGQQGACAQFGADEAFAVSELDKKMPTLLAGCRYIYYPFDLDAALEKRIKAWAGRFSRRFLNVNTVLHEMRLIKSDSEIKLMRKAAQISAAAHRRLIHYVRPGMMEYELEAEFLRDVYRSGARAVAYNSIVGAGAHACTLHYEHNNGEIKDNDLVLVDAGAEYECYASDITRTFPANGRFTTEQKAIYSIVLEAQQAVIAAVKPGIAYDEMQTISNGIISQGLLDLGMVQGTLDEVIESKTYQKFYCHRVGHWIGLDVHDVGRYQRDKKFRRLEPGMVFTVEPGIYITPASGVDSRWHNIGIRIEDVVLVTKDGYDVLSLDAPKAVCDLEAH